MKKCCSVPTPRRGRRSGIVLALVLVVVLVLSFAVYSFSSLMLTEYAATTTGLARLQRRELAASGIEIAAWTIRQSRRSGLAKAPTQAIRQPFPMSLPQDRRGHILLLRQIPVRGAPPEFGLRDESARLNLNVLPLQPSRRRESRRRLMTLPGLTIQMADAILDWMDADDDVSEFGAETSYYTAQPIPRRPRQGRFQSVRELLQVRGVTPELLFGEDLNENGILDPSEDDGAKSLPPDNQDGVLQRGWSEWLTVVSGEGTRRTDGTRKINLNQPVLANLFDQLEPLLGTEAALYLVAWRMKGALFPDDLRPDEGEEQDRRRLERLESVQKRLAAQLGTTARGGTTSAGVPAVRAGVQLTEGVAEFRSLLEVFGGQVRLSVGGRDTLLQSPWAADPLVVRRMLPFLERELTITDAEILPGRININQASERVLRSIPGISESVARAIVAVQAEMRKTSEVTSEFDSVAWLASRGLMSMAELRAIGPWVTTSGDVQGGIAIGQTEGDSPVAMVEFLLDCSGRENRVLMLRDFPIVPASAVGL